ncbi:selenocysteine specific elongation factor [Trichuris trichiura]|uniref:Selenocysteine specific elongation factor n=1 Tax=Trichuris trichiura TaxID=36087 RepID=A0A077ZFB9_TRITR|nr:selenocysteine specific elongation factor [Trichuris trichiura]
MNESNAANEAEIPHEAVHLKQQLNLTHEGTVADMLNALYGFFALVPNALLLIVIVGQRLPRKPFYFCIAAFAASNVLSGIAFILSACRRFYLYTRPPYTLLPIECMLQAIHLTIFPICDVLNVTTSALISLERFLALASNRLAQKNNMFKVVKATLAVIGVISLTDTALCWHSAAQLKHRISAVCRNAEVVSEAYYEMHMILVTVLAYLALLFYLLAFAAMVFRRKTTSTIRAIQLRREIVITRRLSFLILSTLLVVILPLTISFVIDLADYPIIEQLFWICDTIHVSLFVFIYSASNPELRFGILRLMNRVLPWRKNSAATTTRSIMTSIGNTVDTSIVGGNVRTSQQELRTK